MRPARRSIAAALAVASLVAAWLVLSPGAVAGSLQEVLFSPWFPLVLAGLYLVRPLLAWPITGLSVLVGYRYGLVVGFPVALAGVVATSLVPYAAARYLRTDAGLLGRATAGSERFFAAAGDLRGVIAARLAPTPAEVVSGAAGAGRVPVPAFVLGTAVGELPWTGAAVLAGHSMRHLALADAAPEPWLVAATSLAALVLLAGPAYRFARSKSI